jgi:hypothetical protein
MLFNKNFVNCCETGGIIIYRIYICYVEESRPPLWSGGQSCRLQKGEVLFPVRYELNLYVM